MPLSSLPAELLQMLSTLVILRLTRSQIISSGVSCPHYKDCCKQQTAVGEVRTDVDPDDLLTEVERLCMRADDESIAQTRAVVALLVDGLRYGAKNSQADRQSTANIAGYQIQKRAGSSKQNLIVYPKHMLY
jgi:hypothetical protein